MSASPRVAVGAALGVAVALIVAMVWVVTTVARTTAGPTLTGSARILSGADALALGCQPDASALVHPGLAGEASVLTVRCVEVAPAGAAARPRAGFTSGVVTRASAQPVVQRVAVERAPRDQPRPDDRPWQKTTLVIAGSTATGAGVGGLIGGKKGALIGAAIGGGASSIYESAKR